MTYDANHALDRKNSWISRLAAAGVPDDLVLKIADEAVSMERELDTLRLRDTVLTCLEQEAKEAGFADMFEAMDAALETKKPVTPLLSGQLTL